MASTVLIDIPTVFVDSSVLFSASLSSTGAAHDLILAAARGQIVLIVSQFVLLDTQRNLTAKAPRALPPFKAFERAGVAQGSDPPNPLVGQVAKLVVHKDAPIVAGAIAAKASFLASYDRKHLLSQAAVIQSEYGIVVDTPDNILDRL